MSQARQPATLQVGDEAPNFDLASTEDVVLMLRDEVPRTPVLLFFFEEVADDGTRSDLGALAKASRGLAELGVKIMAISTANLDELKAAQKELSLPFPLLHDDRNLSAAYGVETTGFGLLVLVGRRQQVLWSTSGAVEEDAVLSAAKTAQKVSSTVNYPRKVINRLVDRWVN